MPGSTPGTLRPKGDALTSPSSPPHGAPRAEGTPRDCGTSRGPAVPSTQGTPAALRTHRPIPVSALVAGLLALVVPVGVLAVFFVFPTGAMVARGVAASAWETYTVPRTWRLVGTTVGLAAAATAGAVLLGMPAAHALYRTDFWGRRALRALLTMPFVLPTVVVGAAFSALLRPGGLYGFLGLQGTPAAVIAAMVFFNIAVVVRTVGPLWASVDPRMVDAARMLGAGPLRALRTVTLPALAPAIASAATLVFLFCSTSYGIVMTLGGVSTLESEIWSQSTRLNFDRAAALSLLQMLIVAACLVLSARTPSPALRLRPGRPQRGAAASATIAMTLTTALVLVIAPLTALVVRSLREDGAWTLAHYASIMETGAGFSGGATVLEALGTSIRMALWAAVIALGVGIPLAVVLSRPARGGRMRRVLLLVEGLAMAPIGISAVTLGFGYLLVMVSGPLYLGSRAVPFAQAIVAVPLVLRALLPTLRSIDPRLRETAAMLGAGPLRVLLTVDAPLALRALAQAAGFAVAISLGEFGAASFLATGADITLPVLISRLLGRPGGNNYEMALAASVVLGALTACVMGAADTAGDARRGAGLTEGHRDATDHTARRHGPAARTVRRHRRDHVG